MQGAGTGEGGGHSHSHDAPKRREIIVNGSRVRTVDIHAHCVSPEALALMDIKVGGGLRSDLDMGSALDIRLRTMDAQGIDVEALSINPNW
jgi:aminocarboxymuconate-semialdehyde decarboxylase